MSEVKPEKAPPPVKPFYYPPQFPVDGFLPRNPRQVLDNLERQRNWERDYHDALAVAAGKPVPPPCSKTLHISLFFDGTGNNLNNDLYLSDIPHPTNIARLFRASIGAGYAGGTAHAASKAQGLTDASGIGHDQYCKYYMPGVGTPFPEIGDLNYSTPGLALARYGEERINWGLLMIIDALRRVVGLPSLDAPATSDLVRRMTTNYLALGFGGEGQRRRVFQAELNKPELAKPLLTALTSTGNSASRLMGIKLYVYGFSRGAAAARAFVYWLSKLLHHPGKDEAGRERPAEHSLMLGEQKLPLSVEYLGLLDTVASVGVVHLVPIAEGHMGWASGNQELPREATYGGWIKRCLHIVAAHEQRLCFPLDSVRRTNGEYPSCAVEVLHPGVHSDQGGGYPPQDQGKGYSKGNIQGDALLLSQIALHSMYADAFARGAPLKVPKGVLPQSLKNDAWRVMDLEQIAEFDVADELVDRFNAWRELTLGLHAEPQPLPPALADHYTPTVASTSLERALQDQMGWITAWRIDRYAFMSMEGKPFYEMATDTESGQLENKQAKARRKEKQKEVEARRREQLDNEKDPDRPSRPLEPGPKDFDPDMGKTQLREGAKEFGEDYRGTRRTPTGTYEMVVNSVPFEMFYLINSDDELAEYLRMKELGRQRVKELFPPPSGRVNHQNENDRGPVDERQNEHLLSGQVRALFDNQVHDSRAWFLYTALDGQREPWNGYFRERMVYFGDAQNKKLSLLSIAGGIVGASAIVGGVVYAFSQKSLKDKLDALSLLNKVDPKWMADKISILDKATGLPVPMLPDAAALQAPTSQLGALAKQQRTAITAMRIAQAQQAIAARWPAYESTLGEVRDALV